MEGQKIQAWLTIQEGATLEGISRRGLQLRVDRGRLKARCDTRGQLLVRVAYLSPAAQEKYTMQHGPSGNIHDTNTHTILANFPERARTEAVEWLHLLRTAPENGIPQWHKDKTVGGRTITYRTFCRKRQAMCRGGSKNGTH